MWRLQFIILVGTIGAGAQSRVDLGSQAKNYDFANAPFTRPAKTGPVVPLTCNTGELFYNTAAAPGANLYGCTAANTWNVEGNGSGVQSVVNGDATVIIGGTVSNPSVAVNPASVVTQTGNNDLTGASTFGFGATGFNSVTVPNEGTVGTTASTVTVLTTSNPSSARIGSAGVTARVIGIAVSGSGLTGNARVAVHGWVACTFDNATVAGDYVQVSSTTDGKCHDAGAARPASGLILGFVTSTNASAGVYNMLLVPTI